MAIRAGMTSSTRMVAIARPKIMVIAIGIKNCACKLVSNNKGVRPPMVVSDVSRTARNRSWPPPIMAGMVASPPEMRSSIATEEDSANQTDNT